MRRLYVFLATFVFSRLPRGMRAAALPVIDRVVLMLIPRPRARRGVTVLFIHGLGDMVLFTGSLKIIRAQYANHPLVLVCSRSAEDYARIYLVPDRVIVLDRDRLVRNLPYRILSIWRIARLRTAHAIQPAFNRLHLVEDALIRASGADTRIGSTGSDLFITGRERSQGDPWYTNLIAEPARAMHDLERSALFLEAVTGRTVPMTAPTLPPAPPHASVPASPYFVIALDASTPQRTWPAENFMATLETVARTSALVPVVIGTRPSRSLAPGALDLTGKTDLDSLVRVIANARIVIANDSAPTHLARALGVPVVAICGGGLPVRYLPYPEMDRADGRLRVVIVDDAPWSCFGCGWRCVRISRPDRATPCIAGIGVARVVDEALDLLASTSVET